MLKEKVSGLMVRVEELKLSVADVQASIDSFEQAAYQRGYTDGVASVQNPNDPSRIYTQADLDSLTLGLRDQVTAAQVAAQNHMAELESVKASIPAEVEKAIEAFKAQIAEAYANAQSAESAIEASVAELLKPKAAPAPVEPAPAPVGEPVESA